MKIIYHGHSFLEIITDVNVLIDPYATSNPLCDKPASDFTPDAIFLTHGHTDHLEDAQSISKRTGCPGYAVAELARWLSAKKVNALSFNLGGTIHFGDLSVTAIQALHSSSTPDGGYGGVACGFVVGNGEKTIYHAGDTSFFSDMKLISDDFDLDAAFLPIGGHYTMDVENAVKAAKLLSPAIAVPIHYNTFSAIRTDPELFCKLLRQNDIRCDILEPGSSIRI